MTTSDIIHETYSALTANKVRSGLTMLGIVIGIGSVIAMTAIGAGAQTSISSSIQSLGSNLVIVMPGAQRSFGGPSSGRGSAQSLTLDDANAIKNSISNVAAVDPETSGRYQVTATGTNTNTSVSGVSDLYPTVRNAQVDQGSFISAENVSSVAKVAVLGPTTASDLFGDSSSAVGQSIRIKNIIFKVIGVMVSKGGTGFGNQDDAIYIPITTAQHYLTGNEYLSSIDIAATDSNSMTQVQNDTTTLLLSRHHINDPTQADFNTLNQADIVKTASGVTGTFTILLGAVAGISLLVGGIGIMNMMLTTVTERTKEIGLRKAIGAKGSDISIQFLIESVMLTFTGGAIGVALGWSIAFIITKLGILQTSVSLGSVLLAFGVSAAIGIIFGYYPARRASRLNPIDALRYE